MTDGFQLLRGVAFALMLAGATLYVMVDSAGNLQAAMLIAQSLVTVGAAAMFAGVAYPALEVILVALWRAAMYRRAEFSDTHVAIQPARSARRERA